MMAQDVVICEVLCFMRNNVDKTPPSQLQPVLVNFYKDVELIAAKELLLKAVQRALHEDAGNSQELPRLPKRQGDSEIRKQR